MNKEVISIVVPIYKVEKYIKKCIDSIIKQTYKNIEIILVDDGSPDGCGKICDEYAQKDKRVKVIHKENGGLSDARNVGIDISTGKYICFVDSDDYIENNYIEVLYKYIVENKVSISQCGINKVTENEQIIENIGYQNDKVENSKQILRDLYNTHWENIVVWNKMYLRKLFEDIRFPKGKIHEDEFTTYKVLYKVSEVAIINENLYNYRQNNESITRKIFNLKRLDALEAFKERLEFFKKNEENELYELTLKSYLANIRIIYNNVKKYMRHSKKIRKKLKEDYKEYCRFFFINKNVSYKERIKIKLFVICPPIYYLKFILKKKKHNY